MNEEEYFRKNYPDSCYGDKPLSPYWDFFQDGVEFGERQSEEKIQELERKLEQTEKDLADYQFNYPTIKELQKELDYQKQARSIAENVVVDLTKENAKLKCECRRCIHTDCPCVLSDYGKNRNGICDHFKDVFDENAEQKLKLEALDGQIPWKDIKDKSEVIGKLTKAKEIIKDFLLMAKVEHLKDRYETVDEAEQFLSEVEK